MKEAPLQLHTKNKSRLVHIECLRIIAIYLVIFNHTGGLGVYLYAERPSSVFYGIYLFFSLLAKISVPLFFMISGALLLGKDDSYKDLYFKRIFRIIVALIASSLINYIYQAEVLKIYVGGGTDFIKKLYSTSISGVLWYLYSYLGMLVMLPLLRKMTASMKKQDYIYMAALQLIIVGVLPVLQFVIFKGSIVINSSFKTSVITEWNIFYVLMGYYFEKVINPDRYTKKNAAIGLAAAFFAITAECIMVHYHAGIIGYSDFNKLKLFYDCFALVPSFAVYFAVKVLFLNTAVPCRICTFITLIGSGTFFTYLIEEILRRELRPVFDIMEPFFKTFPSCLLWCVIVVLVGCIIGALLKRIPIINRFI